MNDFMKRKFMKRIVVFCLGFAVLMSSFTASAANPAEAYINQDDVDGGVETVYSRDVYQAVRQINASSLGVEKLEGITDVYCDKEGDIYLLDGKTSQILILNQDYEFVQKLDIREEDGSSCTFAGAEGIYVNQDKEIFIADTLSARVLIANSDGVVKQILETPESDVIPEDFYFQPKRVLEDNEGYFYVLSSGCYYGALLYSSEYEFLGFYGANEVESTILNTLSYLWELLTSNDEKKSQQAQVLPYTIIDMAMDDKGYVYTGTGLRESYQVGKGQIRKISPGGSNILYHREFNGTATSASNYNFMEPEIVKRLGYNRNQNLVAIDVSGQGYIYALDATYGKIYMYDKDCNLITVFGSGTGTGTQLGTFKAPVSLATCGNDVLVADSESASLTLFRLTDFGETLLQAQKLYFDSNYVEAMPYWEEILKQDGNSRLAYRGLGKAYYVQGDMDAALKYSKLGMDYATYDDAHQEQITEFVQSNFIWLFLLLILVIAALVALLLAIKKRETPLIRNEKLHCFFTALLHPFRSFHDVKYKKLGSMKLAIGVTALLLLSAILTNTRCGFLFRRNDAESYSALFTVAQTAGLLILWSVANWAICTIMDGKGRLKEVYIVSSYAVLPLALYNLIYLALSHVVNVESVDAIVGFKTLVLIYTFYLLCVGIMTVHEYNFPKFLWTSIVAVLIMILVVFIGFVLVILIQQLGNFLLSLYMEVVYR